MRTDLFKPSLLVFALAAIAGGAIAQDCPSNSGDRAGKQTPFAAPTPASADFVYADPYANMLRMQAAMAREFNTLNALQAMNAMWLPVVMAPPLELAMPTQVSTLQRTKNGYKLQVRLPGFRPEDIHVQLDGRLLSISAQESAKEIRKAGNEPAQAFSTRSFVQTLTLPGPVEATGLKQSVQNGVLTITIPGEQTAPGST